MDKYLEVVKYGNYHCTDEGNYTCDRCYRNNLITFVNYKEIDLCLRCVDAVSNFNWIKPNPEPILVKMEQYIYKNYPYNKDYIDNITINRIVILEQISEENFIVLLNDKREIMTGKDIARKYCAWRFFMA